MKIIADLQLHSKFSRAVSKEMTIPNLALWAKKKGIGLIATGDWTHPKWFSEIERDLEEMGNGLLRLRVPALVANENLDPPVGAQVASTARGNKNFLDPLLATVLPTRNEDIAKLGKRSSKILSPLACLTDPLFLLASEVSCIYTQGGKGRRVHTLIWVPSLDSARKISKEMTRQGCNLLSDGRPIIGLTSIQVAELVFSIEPKALVIPAHIYTPWFSTYGSKSGFDSIASAFGKYAERIYAVETGLSSNPAMNWCIPELDSRTILSFSDAHSLPKLGREATVFEFPDGELSYDAIYQAISQSNSVASGNKNFLDPLLATVVPSRNEDIAKLGKRSAKILSPSAVFPHIAYTIEFYPEEGKYHYTGHRACNVRLTPEETRRLGKTCSVCGKPLTEGVMDRVETLSSLHAQGKSVRTEENIGLYKKSIDGISVLGTYSKTFPDRPPFVMLVPLREIISECIGSPVASPKVSVKYDLLLETFGTEFDVLLKISKEEIERVAGPRIAEGIEKVRTGDIVIDPGYDGVFGVVKLWKENEEKPLIDDSKVQLGLLE